MPGARRELIPPQARTDFLCLHFVSKNTYSSFRDPLFFIFNTGPQPSFKSQSLNIQHPYPATASPSRFHSHPGQLTPDKQTTAIVRETQQTYHIVYLSLSRKISKKGVTAAFINESKAKATLTLFLLLLAAKNKDCYRLVERARPA